MRSDYGRFAVSNFSPPNSVAFESRATSILNPWLDIIRDSVQLSVYQGIAKSPNIELGKKDVDKLLLFETIVNGSWSPGVCLAGIMAALQTAAQHDFLNDLRDELSSVHQPDLGRVIDHSDSYPLLDAVIDHSESYPLLDAVAWEAIRLFHSPEIVARQAHTDTVVSGYAKRRSHSGRTFSPTTASASASNSKGDDHLFEEESDLAVFGCVNEENTTRRGEATRFRIRKGDIVLGLMPLANRDESIFGDDSAKFRPRRFLEDSSLKTKVS